MSKTGACKTMASTTKQALTALLKELQRGNSHELLRLFAKDQACEIFPKGYDTFKWLTRNLGKKNTAQFISALSSLACFNCKEGLQTCENCDGSGHFEHEMVCETCLGLASISCNFCGGTGLASIDYIPISLRLAVFAVRLENAEKQIAALLKKPVTSISAKEPTRAFSDCATSLLSLNRQISVLESAVSVAKDMIKVPRNLSHQFSKITRDAVQVAIKGQKRLSETVTYMIGIFEMQAKNGKKGTKMYKLTVARKQFYSSLLNSSPPFAGTYLEHISLNDAAKRLNSN
jgi:hypothetical protein